MDRKTGWSARVFLRQYCFRKSFHSIADILHIPIFDARIPAVWKALEDTDRTVWKKVSSTRRTRGNLPDCPFSSHAREPEPTGYPTLSCRPALTSMRRHHPGIEQIFSSIEAMPYPIAPPASAAVSPDISYLFPAFRRLIYFCAADLKSFWNFESFRLPVNSLSSREYASCSNPFFSKYITVAKSSFPDGFMR